MRLPAWIFSFVLLLDGISKYLTVKYLTPIHDAVYQYPYGGIGVFKDYLGVEFSINFATNTGAAWSLFSDYTNALLVFRIGLILFLFYYLFYLNKQRILVIPLALILAGAVGNVLDIFFYGHVIDMFHFVLWGYDYPIFNVADASICFGIALYLLASWRK